jgi:DNA polymerase III alpha subunit
MAVTAFKIAWLKLNYPAEFYCALLNEQPIAKPHLGLGEAACMRMLHFRDYLRSHPETAHDYEVLKRRLATEYRFEREVYQDSKTAFIREVEALIRSSGATATG